MPRVAPQQTVNPKTFRHFVVFTVAVAFVLALFATGESRQGFEAQLAEKSEQKKLEQAEQELAKQGKGGNTSVVFKDNRKNKTTWDPDYETPGVQEVSVDADGAPELVGGSGPRYINLPSTAGRPVAAAPPGMSGLAMEQLAKKKKKRVPKEGSLRRPPPTEEEDADY